MPPFQLDDLDRALALGTPLSGVSLHGSAALWLDPRRPYLAVAAADRRCGKRGNGPLGTVLGAVPSRLIIRDGTSQLGREELLAADDRRRNRYSLAELLTRHHEVRTVLRRVVTRLAHRHGHFVVHHVTQAGVEMDGLGELLGSLGPQVVVVQHTVDLEGLDRAARRQLRSTLARTLMSAEVRPADSPPRDPGTCRRNAAIFRIDVELVVVAATLDVEALVTPSNLSAVRKAFLADPGHDSPAFEYAPLPVDCDALRARLFALPVHDLPAGPLATELAARRRELALELELLERRGTRYFCDRARELHGAPDSALVTTALEILVATEGCTTPDDAGERLGGMALRACLAELSSWLGLPDPPTMRVGAVLDRARVSGGQLLLPRGYRANSQHVAALAIGEIGGRLIPRFNGAQQPLRLAMTGFAGARRTEEGRVVVLEYLHGVLAPERIRELAARVVSVADLLSGESFATVFQRLRDQYHFPPSDAWRICARIYRGGGWVAEALPLAGFLELLRHLGRGGTLTDVLGGCWPLAALDNVEALTAAGWLAAPRVVPPAELPGIGTTALPHAVDAIVTGAL